MDALNLRPQSYRNYRTVLRTLFEFAIARGYAADNRIEGVQKLKVRDVDIEIFKPGEIARLLEACRANYPDYLPILAIGAFAGLRSAEIEQLGWQNIDFTSRHIVVSVSNAKTASRRIVPLCDNLAAWLSDTPPANRPYGRLCASSASLSGGRQGPRPQPAIEVTDCDLKGRAVAICDRIRSLLLARFSQKRKSAGSREGMRHGQSTSLPDYCSRKRACETV